MEFEEIKKLFSDDFSYITDILSVVKYMKKKNIPKGEQNLILTKILEHNNKLEEDAKKVLDNNKRIKKKIKEEQEEEKPFENREIQKENIFDVSNYLNGLLTSTDSDFTTEILPSIYDSNYKEIILSILISLYSDINYANNLLAHCKDAEEEKYLKEEIKKYSSLIDLVKDYNKEEEEEESLTTEESNSSYNLFYLPKNDGTSYILDDIEDIDKADYESTKALISNLINGVKMREKRFYNLEDLKGLSAVRKQDSRIVFQRLGNNAIFIIGIFTKRCQNTLQYRDFIRNRAKIKNNYIESIKDRLNDTSFIEEENIITDEILTKLSDNLSITKRRS